MSDSTGLIVFDGSLLPFTKINDAALAYLVQYGYNKSLQDSVAGMKKEMAGAGASEEEITSALAAGREERHNAVMNGTLGVRGPSSPRVSSLETTIRRIAVEEIKAKVAARKGKLPKGDAYDSLIAAYIAAKLEDLTAKAEVRLAASAAVVLDDFDINSLLGE